MSLTDASDITACIKFENVKAWGKEENDAREIDGIIAAVLVRKQDGWHVVNWHYSREDQPPHPPDMSAVDKVEGTELTETDRMEMWN
jgi:hypothetical protein